MRVLSEVSQKEEDKYPMISLISAIYYTAQRKLSSERKIMDLENKLVDARGKGRVGGTGILG